LRKSKKLSVCFTIANEVNQNSYKYFTDSPPADANSKEDKEKDELATAYLTMIVDERLALELIGPNTNEIWKQICNVL